MIGSKGRRIQRTKRSQSFQQFLSSWRNHEQPKKESNLKFGFCLNRLEKQHFGFFRCSDSGYRSIHRHELLAAFAYRQSYFGLKNKPRKPSY